LPHVDGVATFFSSVLLDAALGLATGIVTDLLIARRSDKDYRRQAQHE